MFKRILPENIETNLIDDVERLNNFITRSLLQAADLSIPIKYKNEKYKHLKCLPSFLIQLIESRKFYRKEMGKKIAK